MAKLSHSKGFTLIELMVVVLIIAILGALAMVAYGQANRSARDGKRKADMEVVKQALLLHRQENAAYVSDTSFPGIVNELVNDGFLSEPAPVDPLDTGVYEYEGTSGGSDFCICAELENDRGNSNNNSCSSWNNNNTGGFYCATAP